MFCSKCGNPVEEHAAFCPNCGNKIGSAADAAPEPIDKCKKEGI